MSPDPARRRLTLDDARNLPFVDLLEHTYGLLQPYEAPSTLGEPETPEAREARIDRTSDHHLWMGAKTERGFGQVRVDGRLRTAAQVA